MTPIDKFLVGFLAPFRGTIAIFSSVKLFFLALLPLLIAFAIIFGGMTWAYYNLNTIVAGFVDQMVAWGGALFTILANVAAVLAWVGFMGFALVAGYILVNIFAGPFLSLIAEESFRQHSPDRVSKGSMRLIVKMFMLSLVKTMLFLSLGLLNLVLSFFPPLNIIGIMAILLTISFDCVDYSMEMDFMSLAQRFKFFWTHFWYFLGLSMAILATNFIPGAFFVLLPGFVAGAAKMYLDLAPQR